jgi:hypothetical protein
MMKKQLMLAGGVLFAALVMAQDKSIPPPPPPVSAVENLTPPPPSINDDYMLFLKRNPSVKSLGWLANGSSVRIRLKSGKEELYNLNSEKEIAVLNRKYGRLPIAPPPPPRLPVEP